MFKQCNTGSLFARQDKEEFGSKNSSQKFLIDVKHHNGHDPSHSPKMRGWGVEEKQGQLNVPCCKTAVGEPDAKKCGTLKYNRRFCRFEGCARVVKSQGLCQRHGAKPCMCKVIGCFKQAQGGCDRMCKSHFKNRHGLSCLISSSHKSHSVVDVNFNNDATDAAYEILVSPEGEEIHIGAHIIPLADHLENGYRNRLSFGWHRNYQRVTRGLNPINGKSSVLDAWEFRLVWNELLLLKGFENPSVWIHLAYGWGQRLGFHVEAIAMIGQLQGKNNSPKREPNSVALSKMRDGLNKDLTEQSLEASYFAFIADSLKTETNSPFGSMIE